jgi:hypothetical protein
MARIAQQQISPFTACVVIAVAICGCSNTLSRQLLDDRQPMGGEFQVNSLVAPPAEILKTAVASPNANDLEETELPPDVPTLADLSSRPIEGIDAPKVALALEQDVALKKISTSVRWRGKRSIDGVDLANSSGTLCSSAGQNSTAQRTLKVACSDGRVALLEFSANQQARLVFRNNEAETVQLDN